MHGRKRDEYKAMFCRDEKMVQKLSSKALAWHTLQTELLHRQNTFHNTLTVTDKVVEMKQEKRNDYGNNDSIPIDTAHHGDMPNTPNESEVSLSSPSTVAVEASSSSAVDTASSSVKSSSLSTTTIITSEFVSSTLELLQKAITVNPDPIWLWIFRRQLVLYQLLQLQSMDHGTTSDGTITTTDNTTTTTTSISSLLDHEHNITQLGLQNNPKAYAVWHYRKWCIQQQIQYMITTNTSSRSSTTTTTTTTTTRTTKTMIYNNILNNEIQLINLLLQKDERNFHCWSYRRYIISCYLYIIVSSFNTNSNTSNNNHNTNHHKITGEWLLPNRMNNSINNDTDDNDIESTIRNVIMGAQIATLQKKHHQNHNSDNETKNDTGNVTSTNNITSTSTSTTGTTSFLHNDDNDDSNINFDTTVIQQEWDFTTIKIHDNFSNFSAFHYRSKLLPLIIMIVKQQQGQLQQRNDPSVTTTNINDDDDDDNIIFQSMIQKEFELVTNAIYTEPDDQTAWWYQIFLFHTLQQKHKQQMQQNRGGESINTKSTTSTTTSTSTADNSNLYPTSIILKINEQIVIPHLQQLRELQNETNSKSKWVLIGIVQCLQYLNRTSNGTTNTNTDTNTNESYKEECCHILQSLIQIDPDRKERYKYQLRLYK